MVNQVRHTNWQLSQYLQYQTYVLYFTPGVVQNATAHVDTKALNMHYRSQNILEGDESIPASIHESSTEMTLMTDL